MSIVTASALSLAFAIAASAAAQDIPSPYESAITDNARLQTDSLLAKRRLKQARERQRAAAATLSPRSRALCRDKARVARGLPPAKGRQLYALCARAGL